MQATLTHISEILKESNHILVLGHRRLDGDSYGCIVALARVLGDHGKRVLSMNDEPVPKEYSFLDSEHLFVPDLPSDFHPDCIVACDSANLGMLGSVYERYQNLFESGIPVINIDHHPNTLFGTVNLVRQDVASAGCLVYSVIEEYLGEKPKDSVVLEAILAGVVYDTANFRNSNTTASMFELTSELMAGGADHQKIVDHLYRSQSLERIKLWGDILSGLESFHGGRVVGGVITRELRNRHGFHTGKGTGSTALMNHILTSIGGTAYVFLLSEEDDGTTKVSLRSRSDKYDMSMLAGLLGGGGHIRASGAHTTLGIDEVKEVIKTYYVR